MDFPFYFTRHQETFANRERILKSWSDDGMSQIISDENAVKKGELLTDSGIIMVFSSPLGRAYQTAEAIIRGMGGNIPLYAVDELRDISCGPLDGEDIDTLLLPGRALAMNIMAEEAGVFDTPITHQTETGVPQADSLQEVYDRLDLVPFDKGTLYVGHSHPTKMQIIQLHNPRLRTFDFDLGHNTVYRLSSDFSEVQHCTVFEPEWRSGLLKKDV